MGQQSQLPEEGATPQQMALRNDSVEGTSTSRKAALSDNLQGSLVGGGTGALLIALIQDLDPNFPYRSSLLLIAPAFAILVRTCWIQMLRIVSGYLETKRTDRLKSKIKETIEHGSYSEEHRRFLIARLESIEREQFDVDVETG